MGTRAWVAVWLFLGCERSAGGESRSLPGEGGFGAPLQVGFGQLVLLVRFVELLATMGRCVGCFALLVDPWASCPTGHCSSSGTSPLSTPLPTAGLLSDTKPLSNLWWH